jgi:hypothetical protein
MKRSYQGLPLVSSSAFEVSDGGTGATSLTGYVVGHGTGPFTSVVKIPAADIDGDIGISADSFTGTVAVENGGTGRTSITTGKVMVGAGTAAVTSTKSAPTGDFVGTTDTQTLTNKTITDPVISNPFLPRRDVTTHGGLFRLEYASEAGQSMGIDAYEDISGKNFRVNDNTTESEMLRLNFTTGDLIITGALVPADMVGTRGNLGLGDLAVKDSADLATADVTGTLPVTRGGTGATTLTGYVKGDGTNALTAASTVPVADITGTLPLTKGGTGATTASDARDALGLGDLATQNSIALSPSPTQITGTLPVPYGGTGATSFSAGYVVVGNGSSALSSSKAVPNGDIVGTIDTQTLTNKTLSTPILEAPACNGGFITANSGADYFIAQDVTAAPFVYEVGGTGRAIRFKNSANSKYYDFYHSGTGDFCIANGDGTPTVTFQDGGAVSFSGALATGDAATTRTNLGLGSWATSSKTIPAGDVVGTTDTQTLSNKALYYPSLLRRDDTTHGGIIVFQRANEETMAVDLFEDTNPTIRFIDVVNSTPRFTVNMTTGVATASGALATGNAAATRTNLGLGDLATQNTATAEQITGLGTMSLQNASSVAITGGTIGPATFIQSNSAADKFYSQDATAAPFQIDVAGANRALRLRNTETTKYWDIYHTTDSGLVIGDPDSNPVFKLTDDGTLYLTTTDATQRMLILGMPNPGTDNGIAMTNGTKQWSMLISGDDYKIQDDNDGTPSLTLSSTANLATFSGNVIASEPTSSTHVATKNYVDSVSYLVSQPTFARKLSAANNFINGNDIEALGSSGTTGSDNFSAWDGTNLIYTVPMDGQYMMGLVITLTGVLGAAEVGQISILRTSDSNLFTHNIGPIYTGTGQVTLHATGAGYLSTGQNLQWQLRTYYGGGGVAYINIASGYMYCYRVSN